MEIIRLTVYYLEARLISFVDDFFWMSLPPKLE